VADELLDPHGHPEKMLENVCQTLGVPHLADERPDVKELGQIGQRVALAGRHRCHAHEGSHVHRETIRLRAIAVDVRLRLGPGPVEKRKEPMMKNVEKPAEGRVARMVEAGARIFREVNRQRPVGAEQAEQPHLKPWYLTIVRLERCQRSGRKRQIRILPEPHWFVDGTEGLSPPRLPVVQAFQPPQRLVKIVAIRRLCQGREEG
jgi:hypothetical protein